jgi:hypothetical protein
MAPLTNGCCCQTLVNEMTQTRKVPRPQLRLEPSDEALLNKLKEKLGLKSTSELFRMSLRALADKEGLRS